MSFDVTESLYFLPWRQGVKVSEPAPYMLSPGTHGREKGLQGPQSGMKEDSSSLLPQGVRPAQTPSDQWGPGQLEAGAGQDEARRQEDPGSNASSVPDWLCDMGQCTSPLWTSMFSSIKQIE